LQGSVEVLLNPTDTVAVKFKTLIKERWWNYSGN